MIDGVLALAVVISAVVGAAVGSFLNVVIHRVPAGLSIVRPASACPDCGHPIRARHNVPVIGWLVLRGRCADCRSPISVRYPLVEAVTAVLFVVVTGYARQEQLLPLLPALLYLTAVGIALALIDIDVHRLPNAIVLPSYPVVAVLLAAASVMDGSWWPLARAGIGGAALFGFFLVLVLIYPAGMGWGDVKLAGVLGLLLGYLGWAALIVGAFAGFLLGAVVALAVLATGRGTRKSAVPFGPFMLAGAAVGVVAGDALAAAYLGALGV